MRYARDFCDALKACEFKHFDNAGEYQDCITAAQQTITDCDNGCAGRGDPTEATDAHNMCRDDCQDTFTEGLFACDAAFDTCLAMCTDPPPVCEARCNAALVGCTGPLGPAFLTCTVNCDTTYTIALAMLALDIDQMCAANCCSMDNTNPMVCEASCITQFTKSVVDAETTLANCQVPCWSWNDGAVFNDDCGARCQNTYTAAIGPIGKTYLECVYPCLGNEQCPIPPQYPIYVTAANELPAINQVEDGSDTSNGCALDFSKVYTDAVTGCISNPGPDSDQSGCLSEAAIVLNRAALECCWNLRGRSLYEDQLDRCGQTYTRCNNAANKACPPPGTDIGQPCFDPFSEECMEAQTDYHNCIDPLLAACVTAKDACVKAITAEPRCNSCPSANDPPPPMAP